MSTLGESRRGNAGKGRTKGVPNRTTANAREAIARFVDDNTPRLQGWLDQIAKEKGPDVAYRCVLDLIEYHVPKLARTELTGKDGSELVTRFVVETHDGPPKPNQAGLHALRLEQELAEAQRQTAALRAALETIAAHDGERYELDADEDGLPTTSKDTPQEIAAKALAASNEDNGCCCHAHVGGARRCLECPQHGVAPSALAAGTETP